MKGTDILNMLGSYDATCELFELYGESYTTKDFVEWVMDHFDPIGFTA